MKRILLACLYAATAAPSQAAPPTDANEQVAHLLAGVIRDAIPRQYEKREDWGQTKNVTTGLDVQGKPFHWRFQRRKKPLRHGVWNQYKLTLADPDHPLVVRVDSLRPLEPGRLACTILVDGQLAGWAQTRSFNRGVHLGTLTAEGVSRVRLTIDCEVGVRMTLSPPALVVDPVVTGSRLELDEFRLHRLGELHGDPAKELGKGLGKLAEDRLEGPRLTAKLNRAIEKKRDRLTISAWE